MGQTLSRDHCLYGFVSDSVHRGPAVACCIEGGSCLRQGDGKRRGIRPRFESREEPVALESQDRGDHAVYSLIVHMVDRIAV